MTRRLLVRALFGFVVFFYAAVASGQILSPGPLSKAHASVEGDQRCSECHASGRRIDTQACNKCHADLSSRMDRGLGLHGREYKGKPCEGCHVEHLGREGRIVRWPGGDQKTLDHALTGWALQNAHRPLACDKCHNKVNARGAPTFLGLSNTCASCHKDPHTGRFGTTCTSCHNDITWKTVKLEQFDHNLARFALHGKHQAVTCDKCHHEPPKYTGLEFAACTSCHKDPHASRFGTTCTSCHNEVSWKQVALKAGSHPGVSLAAGHAAVACATCHDKGNSAPPSRGSECVSCHRPVHKAPFGRNCGSCHASITWLGLPRAVGLSAHSRTAYALTGKHEGANCAGCHRADLPRDARYRQLTFAECKDCHKDNHAGEFASRKGGGGECKSCHTTNGFRPTLFGSALHASTTFPLTGLHVAVACAGCHTTPRPRVNLHLPKQACADCHANPHGTQFAAEMTQGGCGHCHEPTGWHNPKIDHSSWPLTGVHATTACDGCHTVTPQDKIAGRGASYKNAPRDCAGCHDDIHAGQFRVKAPVFECDKCHSTTAFKIPNFDHVRNANYALTGAHAKTQCAQCHPTAALTNGTQSVRWRLPSNECRYCHANPHTRGGK